MMRSLAGPERPVCNVTFIFRARTFFGFYHRFSGPKWLQRITKIYCFFFSTFLCLMCLQIHDMSLDDNFSFWVWYARTRGLQYIFNALASLWTEEASVFSFCTLNNSTDITLDSASIFFKLEKKLKLIMIVSCLYNCSSGVVFFAIWPESYSVFLSLLSLITENGIVMSNLSKLVSVGVLRSRLGVLRARLARHGFARARDCALGVNVYCGMYTAILEAFRKVEGYLKLLMTVDFIAEILCTICMACAIITIPGRGNFVGYTFMTISLLRVIAPLYFLCYEMESAAEQVEAIQEFAVTELLKRPSVRERRAILELEALTAAAPARLPLCRALRVDACLLLTVLSFCTGRVVLILQTLQH